MKSSKLKLVSAVSAVLFSLVTCFTGVFAWFTTQGKGANGTDNFDVETDPNILSFGLSLYKYDYDLAAGYVTYEDDPEFTYVLNKYDKFVPERNTNNNNILRFEIEFANKLDAGNQRQVNFDLKCVQTKAGDPFDNGIKDGKTRTFSDNAGYKYTCESKTYICNKISNVIYFKLLPYTYTIDGTVTKFSSDISIDEDVPANTYADATDAFADIEESAFVTGGNKSTLISGNSVMVNPSATKMVIYIEYSYNQTLVEDFLNPNEFVESPETAEIFTGGVTIEFFKDVLGLYVSSEAVRN